MSNSIKIHVLHCGRVRVDGSLPFKEKTFHPFSWTGLFRSTKKQVWLPVSSYLIEHPKGWVVIDTGWHVDARLDPLKYMGHLHLKANRPEILPGQAIHEQLAQYGVKISDIEYVVLTHMDDDHVGGIKHMTGAKNILVSEPEWESANRKFNFRYRRELWKNMKIKTFKFHVSNFGPMKLAYDLFGDGSIVLVYVPGHSAGMVSVIIQANDRFALLTSDAAYAEKSWEKLLLPGITKDNHKALESLQWIKMMSQQPNCVEIHANHDPNVVPHTILL